MDLPSETFTTDLHCVTKWSKLGTDWKGVSLDTLLEGLQRAGEFALVHSYGGYTTNLPTEDLTDGGCRLPQLWGPMARTAISQRLTWRVGLRSGARTRRPLPALPA